jgi:SNF2 family DNA or RNA helicase
MEIIQNKALLLRLKDPHAVLSNITDSKLVDGGKVLVKWGFDEAALLRGLSIKNVPSPILRDYTWPGGHVPFSHQKKTSSFLTLHRRAFCFNEQGTGKTASVIWAADYLMTLGKINRVLVICPLSVMISAWKKDLFTFAMHRTVGVAHGTAPRRKAVVQSTVEFIIVNYDGVDIVAKEIFNGGFDLIVVDEANAYKNPQTKRWRTLARLLKPDTWLWMLTGTPAAQSPIDAYGLAKLVSPLKVPKFYGAFKDMVMFQVSRFKWEPKPNAKETVFEALQPAIRFTKKECLDLPDVLYVRRNINMSAQQKKYYKLLKHNMTMTASGEVVTAVNAAVAINKLLQVACGVVYTDDGAIVQFDVSERFKALVEVIEEALHKVLVFVPFKHTIEMLQNELHKLKIVSEVVDGSVSVSKRAKIFDGFQNFSHPLKVLLIQPQAAAHGVTLTAADTIVWWGPTTSLETYAQANARVHRPGQKNKVTVVRLVGSPVEQHLYQLLDNKIMAHAQLITLYNTLLDKRS